MTKQNNELT